MKKMRFFHEEKHKYTPMERRILYLIAIILAICFGIAFNLLFVKSILVEYRVPLSLRFLTPVILFLIFVPSVRKLGISETVEIIE